MVQKQKAETVFECVFQRVEIGSRKKEHAKMDGEQCVIKLRRNVRFVSVVFGKVLKGNGLAEKWQLAMFYRLRPCQYIFFPIAF